MQPVTTSTIPNPATAAIPKNTSAQAPKSAKTSENSPTGKALSLPEDIVTLSTSPKTDQGSSTLKKTSQPVSSPERDALLKPSSGESTISIYA